MVLTIQSMPSEHPRRRRNENGIIPIRTGYTWANRAWGQGKDEDKVEGMDVVLVDLIDTAASQIQDYQVKGHIVLCYISAGTVETWRKDYKENKEEWDSIKAENMDWYRETWIDIVNKYAKVKELMTRRWKIAAKKGCDGIESDNVDCFEHEEDCVDGVSQDKLVEAQIKYAKWQAKTAHRYGMSLGLKNSLSLIPELIDHFDYAVNEQCIQYKECHRLQPFTDSGKAIFGAEYYQQPFKIRREAYHYGMKVKNEKNGKWNNIW
eukprot:Awhi_evm1s12495